METMLLEMGLVEGVDVEAVTLVPGVEDRLAKLEKQIKEVGFDPMRVVFR